MQYCVANYIHDPSPLINVKLKTRREKFNGIQKVVDEPKFFHSFALCLSVIEWRVKKRASQ